MIYCKRYKGLLIVLGLSIFSILPLFSSGFFSMHDDTQVARIFVMAKALSDGLFPVRWVEELGYGYGYPIFNFYSPLPYYIGAFFHLLGFDLLLATRLMIIAGILLSAVFMYFLAREFWQETGGIVSALFYIYAPYHAVQTYVRGSIGELWAYAFVPLVFLGTFKIFREKKDVFKWIMIGALGISGVILSHNLSALMIVPFLFLWVVVLSFTSFENSKLFFFYRFLLSILVAFLLTSFYWLPALLEINFTNVSSQVGSTANFQDHFVCLLQLWDSQWGFGGSIPGCIDGMSFKIGKLHLILALFSALFAAVLFLKSKFSRLNLLWHDFSAIFSMTLVFAVLTLISVIFTLGLSRSIWETFSFMSYLQYPWRFLVFISFFTSLLAGGSIFYLRPFFAKYPSLVAYCGAVLVLLLLIFNTKLFKPQFVYQRGEKFYTDKSYLAWTVSKISDEYMPKNFKKPKTQQDLPLEKAKIVQGKGEIIERLSKTGYFEAEIKLLTGSEIKLNIAYFPGWKVFVDEKEASYSIRGDGLYLILDKGEYFIKANRSQTKIEIASNFLSLSGVFVLFAGIIRTTFYGKKTS